MSFLEKLKKDKYLLKETTAAADTSVFVGRGGPTIDSLFAGGFHPDFGKIKELLKQQLIDRKTKEKFNDENTPDPLNIWEFEMEYLEKLLKLIVINILYYMCKML